MEPPKNRAAWLPYPRQLPFQISSAPYTRPKDDQIVVKNGALGINPFDWTLPFIASIIMPYLKYPTILGTDVAGTVVEVGPSVTRFKVGDRVFGIACMVDKAVNDPAEGAFQLYCILREGMCCPSPPQYSDEQVCVVGMGLCTASSGLFHADYLALDLPTSSPRRQSPSDGKAPVVIITGGASSVGSNAVQLATAAGYDVISTASPKNFEYVKSLGATHVLDYSRDHAVLVKDILDLVKDRRVVGAYTIGKGANELCAAVLNGHDAKLTTRRIAMAGGGAKMDDINSALGRTRFMMRFMGRVAWGMVIKMLGGWTPSFIYMRDPLAPGSTVMRVWRDYLPDAIADGHFRPMPPPLVVGKGLEKIQEALDVQRKGTSAQKVVVSL
jgi:NADPH:quinone reductase-like Zn-dependent oxidoreductase